MNYEKLDADLSAELDQVADDSNAALTVFIYAAKPVGPDEETFLRQLGVGGEIRGQEMITANLSPGSIAELTGQPWVRYLKMSRPLRPLQPDRIA